VTRASSPAKYVDSVPARVVSGEDKGTSRITATRIFWMSPYLFLCRSGRRAVATRDKQHDEHQG
jgi:hypothetical protein